VAIGDGGRQARTAHAASGLSRALGAVLSPAARRRGFAAAAVLADWHLVVGPVLATRCQPVLLEARRGVLHVQASSAAALELQHAAPQLLDRVNTYFGRIVARRLRIVQAPPPPAPAVRAEPPLRALAPEEVAALGEAVAAVGDEALRAALLGLGRSLRATASTRRG
jgi:hypothetical protein